MIQLCVYALVLVTIDGCEWWNW